MFPTVEDSDKGEKDYIFSIHGVTYYFDVVDSTLFQPKTVLTTFGVDPQVCYFTVFTN